MNKISALRGYKYSRKIVTPNTLFIFMTVYFIFPAIAYYILWRIICIKINDNEKVNLSISLIKIDVFV